MLVGAGWADLNNARTHAQGRRPLVELVGVDDPHVERDDYAAGGRPGLADGRPAHRVTHTPEPRGARRDGRRRLRPAAGRPHPRRPGLRARRRRAGHQLRPAPRAWPRACTAGPAPTPGCTSRPASAPTRPPRSASPAARRRSLLTLDPALTGDRAGDTRFDAAGARGLLLLGTPRGVAQLGSALRSGRRGRRFKSRHPDQVRGHIPSMDVPSVLSA